jgi:hypothetical protein
MRFRSVLLSTSRESSRARFKPLVIGAPLMLGSPAHAGKVMNDKELQAEGSSTKPRVLRIMRPVMPEMRSGMQPRLRNA